MAWDSAARAMIALDSSAMLNWKASRLRLRWLPVYIGSCALAGGVLMAGVTYWNITIGLYAAGFGAVYGALGWLLMGIVIPRE